MKKTINLASAANALLVLCAALVSTSVFAQEAKKPAAENSDKIYADFRLRYEHVAQDNPLEDADALTLRTRLGYRSKSYNGFSFTGELENNFALIDDFSVPPTGDRVGEFSVVADPEFTEIDQAFIQYKSDNWSGKFGRQVLALDGHRHIGHVGWRQDRQTFDGLTVQYQSKQNFNLNLSYLVRRNRIFSDDADIDSQDTLLNSSYKTPFGKLTAYAYLLEQDIAASNGLDTFGVSFAGNKKLETITYHYAAELATQEANNTFDATYLMLSGGVTVSGVTAKLGYELLGSDNGEFGFATPLATLHKFNGWADLFLATPTAGLEDLTLTLSGNALGGKWTAVYHDFSSDESVAGADDLGDELNFLYTRKFNDRYSGGAKLALYEAGDAEFNRVDTDKFWLWMAAKF